MRRRTGLLAVLASTVVVASLGAAGAGAPAAAAGCESREPPIARALCADAGLAALAGELAKAAAESPEGASERWRRARRLACGVPAAGAWVPDERALACLRLLTEARLRDYPGDGPATAEAAVSADEACHEVPTGDAAETAIACRFDQGGDAGETRLDLVARDGAALLVVRRRDDEGEAQILTLAEADPMVEAGRPLGLVIADFDFDGHPDLSLARFRPAGPNLPVTVLLFDPAGDRFVPHDGLSALVAPAPDPASRTIASTERRGPAHYARALWRWEAARTLVLDHRVACRKTANAYTELTLEIGGPAGFARRVRGFDFTDCLSLLGD